MIARCEFCKADLRKDEVLCPICELDRYSTPGGA